MYDPKNAKETEDKTMLPKDSVLDGIIIKIDDGKVKDFVTSDKWEGSLESPAIMMHIEVKADKPTRISQIFTYQDWDGVTGYSPKSNLGKFKRKYQKLPEIGLLVKIITNSEGFGRIKLD